MSTFFIVSEALHLLVFLVQVAAGFAMTFYYRPIVTDAFASFNT